MIVRMTTETETIAEPTFYRFSVDEYVRMHEIGMFGEGKRVELIDGEVIEMSPIGPLHRTMVIKLTHLLVELVDGNTYVSTQNSILLNDDRMPEPDLAIFQYQKEKHDQGHIESGDIGLLIEVANTSLQYDREIKLPRYAEAGIPEVWIVDLDAQAIEQYTEPRQRKYGRLSTIALGEPIQATQLPGVTFTTDRIFS